MLKSASIIKSSHTMFMFLVYAQHPTGPADKTLCNAVLHDRTVVQCSLQSGIQHINKDVVLYATSECVAISLDVVTEPSS